MKMLNRNKQIFIVEDNEIYSMMLDYIFSKDSTYKFVSFKSGEECLNNLYMNPDIVILDYSLPGMNGYETLKEIKKRNSNTHVVILSNNTSPEIAESLISAGADDYILKQGHGEMQVIEKIEEIVEKDEEKENLHIKPFAEKMLYFLLIVTLLTLGAYVTIGAN